MSTFSMFEIGKSALIAAKKTMDVTSHNIANAATPGYSRQDAFLEPIIQRQALVSGAGVKVAEIRRSRDLFIDAILRSESGREQSFAVQKDVLSHLQTAVSEPSGKSVRAAIDSFWSGWQDLANDPSSLSARAQLMERGRSLVDMFRHIGGQMDSVTNDINDNINALVVRVNNLSERIAGFNVEIARALARQEPASDLMDRRDLLIDELTNLTGGTVAHLGEGAAVRISVAGFPIVDRDKTYSIEVNSTATGTEFAWRSCPTDPPQTMSNVGGRLGGLKAAKEQVLDFRAQFESLFKSIVDDVNSIHVNGYNASGTPATSLPNGGRFFEVPASGADYLKTVQVNSCIVSDPRNICAGRIADPHDGTNAKAIAKRVNGSDRPQDPSFIGIWTAMMGTLGAKAQKVKTGVETQQLLVKELNNRKASVSGVSVDEEMANLIREQHAFNAASRVITIADEVVDTIINRMGHAGR